MSEAFQWMDEDLPPLRDKLASYPEECGHSLALSHDIKLTVTSMVGDLKGLPQTAEAAWQLALNVTAAAATLGAMDGVVSYVGGLVPLAVEDDSQGAATRRISRAFEKAARECIQGSADELKAHGLDAVQRMAHIGKGLTASQVDDVRTRYPEVRDLEEFQHLVTQAMMTAYTVGVIDACIVCVARETPCP